MVETCRASLTSSDFSPPSMGSRGQSVPKPLRSGHVHVTEWPSGRGMLYGQFALNGGLEAAWQATFRSVT